MKPWRRYTRYGPKYIKFLVSPHSQWSFVQRWQHLKAFRDLGKLRERQPTPFGRMYKEADWGDLSAIGRFVLHSTPRISVWQRLRIVARSYRISFSVHSAHCQYEILDIMESILALSADVPGCVVEAGCFKGGSAAKLSLVTKAVNRRLFIFDSFFGLPEHEEPMKKAGTYAGSLEEVKRNIERWGEPSNFELVPGWFEETMPTFSTPIALILLDVDLASSTRTCLKYLYPLLVENGVLYSHDGHLEAVMEVFNDDRFWEREVMLPRPEITVVSRLERPRLIRLVKRSWSCDARRQRL